MPKRLAGDLEQERHSELAAVWGSEVIGTSDRRAPKRRRRKEGTLKASDEADQLYGSEDDISVSDGEGPGMTKGSLHVSARSTQKKAGLAAAAKKEREAKEKKRKTTREYRLHCVVAGGTTRNDVREVFEQYDPKVDLRVANKGNLLNKSHYCVLTFANKALALHAVTMLDGTNQRDTVGERCLKLSLMLSRRQSKGIRMKKKRIALRESRGSALGAGAGGGGDDDLSDMFTASDDDAGAGEYSHDDSDGDDDA